jgi:hypothetical protein
MKVYWNMNLGAQNCLSKAKHVDTSKKIEVVAETLNPKKYKNCPTGSFNVGNPSTGVNRVWKRGA